MVHIVVMCLAGGWFLVMGWGFPAVICVGLGMFLAGRMFPAMREGAYRTVGDDAAEPVEEPLGVETVTCRCGRQVRVDRSRGEAKCPECKRKL